MSHLLGTRAWMRRLKARTLLDRINQIPPREFIRPRESFGKLKKDDFYWEDTQEYLAEKYVWHINCRRKGRYEPTQIVRNFWKP